MLTTVQLRSSRGAQVKPGDRVFVRYEGRLLDGSIFDRNFDFSKFEAVPERDIFSFVLGRGEVIPGWELGLDSARIGQVLRLVIPPELAYGSTVRPKIPANSSLEFTVEVLGFNKSDNSSSIAYDLADIGIRLSKYGLSDAILKGVSTAKIGLDIDDLLVGTLGPDLITGLGGTNKIAGGFGSDLLISTTGSDEFEYLGIEDSLPGKKTRDLIAGFKKDDRINLSALESDIEFRYIGADRFSGLAGEIRFDRNVIGVDLNGDRRNDMEIEFAGKTRIGASSFLT